jgi:uncharacterized protein YndB with AHSA1/START domain
MKLAFPAKVEATRTIACDAALAWDILSDYPAWAEWLPLVTKVTQAARETNFARVELELAAFPDRKIAAESVHAPNTRVLVQSLMGQDPEFVLDWSIAPEGEGQAKVTVKCSWLHTPSNFRAGMGALNPEGWLTALAAHAASFAGDFTTGPTDPATLLEIYETEEGLVCWYRGKKYEMKAVG